MMSSSADWLPGAVRPVAPLGWEGPGSASSSCWGWWPVLLICILLPGVCGCCILQVLEVSPSLNPRWRWWCSCPLCNHYSGEAGAFSHGCCHESFFCGGDEMRKHFLENISLKALSTSSDQGDFRIGSFSVNNLTSGMLVRKRKSKNLS